MFGEVPELSSAIEAMLSNDEFRVRQVVPGSRNRNLAANRYQVDLSSPEALEQLHASIAGSQGNTVGAIVNLLGLAEPFTRPGPGDNGAALRLAQWVLNVLKEFEGDLRESAERGGGWALNFTSLDGKFGLAGRGPLPVAQAATIGMFKTINKEWPEVWVKNVDLDPEMDPQVLFSQVAEEIQCSDGLVEVGLSQNARWKIELVDDPPTTDKMSPLTLDSDSVVLVTGGAYGVTAEATKQLAREARPRLILVGRSPLPAVEPAETRNLADAAALRKYLIEQMRCQDAAATPVKIERAVQRILKDRAIRANIAEMEKAGSQVEYHSVNVRDAGQFGALIDDIYQRCGRLDGVIHGAGVIEDSLIGNKTPESFARVFSTKVDGAVVLANKLRGESLKFLVFFSSVSGRFGNTGQIDYSAANDYLNKLAAHLDQQWPGRVVAINWGPWDGGMISDELRRLYAAKGIHLIPREEGTRFLLSELKLGNSGKPEVLAACGVRAIAAAGDSGLGTRGSGLGVRDSEIDRHPPAPSPESRAPSPQPNNISQPKSRV